MFEFILGFLLSWPALAIIFALGCISEAFENHGWAVFFGLVAGAVSYFYFGLTLGQLLAWAGAYLGVGFLWSFWRYKRYADRVVDEYKDKNETSKLHALEKLHPTKMLDIIMSWVLIWPFSMLENVTSDVVRLIKDVVTKVLKGIYNRIFDSAAKRLGIDG